MFFNQIQIAFNSYIKAIQLLNKKNMWGLVLLSGLVYLLLIGVGAYGLYQGIDYFVDWVLQIGWVHKMEESYRLLKWLAKAIVVALYISSFVAYFSIFKYILLTVASPLYAYISEKADSAITGKDVPFNLNQLIIDVVRGIRISLKNLLKQSWLTLVLWVLSFIPIVGLFSALILLMVDCYYYGFAMLDYNCERKKMSVSESLQFIQQRRGLAVGNGLVFYGLFLLPVIGIIIGPPLSAIAATISLYDEAK